MKFPLVATILVAAAVAVMIGLGIWQLQRAEWKQGLLAQYEQAARQRATAWPVAPADPESYFFRRAEGFCLDVAEWRAVAGRNIHDQPGWVHVASCRTGAEGPGMQAEMGWSRSSAPPAWQGGTVRGIIVPDSRHGIRLVAALPAPGLEASKPPTPGSIPDNHMMYAFQWFIFAAAALVIYLLALRRRQASVSPPKP